MLKLLVDKKMQEKDFFNKIKKRTRSTDMVKNPFTAQITMIGTKTKLIIIMDLEPIYPDLIPRIGLFLAFVSALFSWRATLIMGLILASTYILWTPRFFYWLLKRARKKEGLTGEIRLLGNKEALRGVARAWDK